VIDPSAGTFLFDTSAESLLFRSENAEIRSWIRLYQSSHSIHVSAITVLERVRGYAALSRRAMGERRNQIEIARVEYLSQLGRVWPLDAPAAVVAGEIMALLPDPPTPPRRSHQLAESRQQRLARWRFDAMIAATALV
jgi:predicted nucleic acid-binding protein